MPKTEPFHSSKEAFHHDNTDCPEGQAVTEEFRREGTGGKRLCFYCTDLDAKEKAEESGGT